MRLLRLKAASLVVPAMLLGFGSAGLSLYVTILIIRALLKYVNS